MQVFSGQSATIFEKILRAEEKFFLRNGQSFLFETKNVFDVFLLAQRCVDNVARRKGLTKAECVKLRKERGMKANGQNPALRKPLPAAFELGLEKDESATFGGKKPRNGG